MPFCGARQTMMPSRTSRAGRSQRIVCGRASSLNTCVSGRAGRPGAPKSPAATARRPLLYCLDSHDYPTVEGIDGYGWFTPEQVR